MPDHRKLCSSKSFTSFCDENFLRLNEWKDSKEDTLLIRGCKAVLHKGKAVNRKFVDMEKRFKAKLRGNKKEEAGKAQSE